MTRGVRVHSERGVRGSRALRATADEVLYVQTEGDVPRQTRTPRVSLTSFRSTVWRYWRENGRHALPWRKTKDPYRILVSEVMLQQTQVPRVLEKYKEFLKRFPTVHTLAKASLTEVLKVWSGLGYNRRGKYLHDAARHIVESYAGIIPHDYPALRAIPGIGMYTANAVRVFAFNEAEVLLETNVRTAIIHHFLSEKRRVEDSEIEKIAAAAAEGQDPRTWHSALFDYGSYLKQRGVRVNTKSTQYVRQSKFEGSLRQVRGAILRALHTGATTEPQLYLLTCASKQVDSRKKFKSALTGLVRDGLVAKAKGDWKIA